MEIGYLMIFIGPPISAFCELLCKVEFLVPEHNRLTRKIMREKGIKQGPASKEAQKIIRRRKVYYHIVAFVSAVAGVVGGGLVAILKREENMPTG